MLPVATENELPLFAPRNLFLHLIRYDCRVGDIPQFNIIRIYRTEMGMGSS